MNATDILQRAALAVTIAALAGCSCSGSDQPVGEVHDARVPAEVREAARQRQRDGIERLAQKAGYSAFDRRKHVLFGDLHVHSTYSVDAFTVELPFMGLQGIHTPADACDFARYCANLDFFSLTDHAENFTPEHWQASKDSLRQCAAVSGHDEDPDVIPFAGWEWTQVGLTPETHWGHKNVIFPDLEDERIPARPINSRPYGSGLGIFNNVEFAVQVRWMDPLNWKRYGDLRWLLDRVRSVPECPRGVPSRELPLDCHENAPTPAELFAKLDEWGFDALVIPHGNTWGLYTPPLADWDKALNSAQHDPERQGLIEVMSGHGNSEEYRSWRGALATGDGMVCPQPSASYLPCCHQAGEMMRARCGELPSAECDALIEKAKRLTLEAGASFPNVFPEADSTEWLNCGQCEDCFKPSFGYNPTESTQYALSRSNFDARQPDGRPLRFRFGMLAATDDHTARPGTGYKQYERRKMTFASGSAVSYIPPRFPVEAEDPNRPQPARGEWVMADTERAASFTYPGGIMGVHATERNRKAVWAALKRKEVYGTSGPRMLLWFDLINAPQGRLSMGSETEMDQRPQFEVRALGDFVQKPGCPPFSQQLEADRLKALCAGECYHPGDRRHAIQTIEIVRIRPQAYPGEPAEDLIEDPWKTVRCNPNATTGCVAHFRDRDFVGAKRDTLYYARALQVPTEAINAAGMRTSFDENGAPVAIDPCYGDMRTPLDDDCLAPAQERAWSSPIFINHSQALNRDVAEQPQQP